MRPSLTKSSLLAATVSIVVLVTCWFLASIYDKRPDTIVVIHKTGLLTKRLALKWLLADLLGENNYALAQTLPALERIDSHWSANVVATDAISSYAAPLKGNDENLKTTILHNLVRFGVDPQPVLPFIIGALTDPSPSLRKTATDILGNIGKPELIYLTPLARASFDEDETVRSTATSALERIAPAWETLVDPSSVFPEVSKALTNRSEILRQRAVKTYTRFGSRMTTNAVPALLSALVDDSAPVRLEASNALTAFDTNWMRLDIVEDQIKVLVTALQHRDPRVRQAAQGTLVEIGKRSPTCVSYLIWGLTHLNGAARDGAAAALEQIGPKSPEAIENLFQNLMASDDDGLNSRILSVLKGAGAWNLNPPTNAFKCLGEKGLQPTSLEVFDLITPTFMTNWNEYERNFLDLSWKSFHHGTNNSPFFHFSRVQERIERPLARLESKTSTRKTGGCLEVICLDDQQAEQLGYDPKECLFILFKNPSGELRYSNPRASPSNSLLVFAPEDIKGLPSLAAKINEGRESVSRFVNERLTESARQALSVFTTRPKSPAELRSLLAKHLNHLVQGPSIYNHERFKDVQLAPQTQKLLGKRPNANDLIRLNASVLADAYPSELVVSSSFTVSIKNIEQFAAKLRDGSDILSSWVWEQLDDAAKKALPKRTSELGDADVRLLLIAGLNAALTNQTLYDSSRFRGITLRTATSKLLPRAAKGANITQLNRLLLEDAFPEDLARTVDVEVKPESSATWRFMNARFTRLSTGWVRLQSLDSNARGKNIGEVNVGTGELVLITNNVPFFTVFLTEKAIANYNNRITSELLAQSKASMSIEEFSFPEREFWSVLFFPYSDSKRGGSSSGISYSLLFSLIAGAPHAGLKDYVKLFEPEQMQRKTWIERAGVAAMLGNVSQIEPAAMDVLGRIAKDDTSPHVRRVATHAMERAREIQK